MIYENKIFDQERSLYAVHDAEIKNCRFSGPADGESPLKETKNIDVKDCFFDLRYPLWHLTDGKISGTEMTEKSRAALWYDRNVKISGSKLLGIKAIRECKNIFLESCVINSTEFAWKTENLNINDCRILQSEYPFFEVSGGKINKLKMNGKYSFQYCSDLEISDSLFDTKDAFWHAENCTILNSEIKGEYSGWYSENLTFINCKITGTQPFCYCKNLKLINCRMENCDLAFENSTVSADIKGRIESVKNPSGGEIRAEDFGGIILDKEHEKASGCKIITVDCKPEFV